MDLVPGIYVGTHTQSVGMARSVGQINGNGGQNETRIVGSSGSLAGLWDGQTTRD